jgi:transposase
LGSNLDGKCWCQLLENTPESPDFNPIENLWHELKKHLRREVKPFKKKELIDGINQFWHTVDKVNAVNILTI